MHLQCKCGLEIKVFEGISIPLKILNIPRYVCTEVGPEEGIPVLPEADFIEEVVSITEDEDWSENEMYSAEDNDFSAELFQNK